MVYLIPKARMHPVERAAVVGGLLLVGLAAAVAPSLVFPSLLLAVVFHRADRLEYRWESEGLRVGGELLPFPLMRDVRVVRLDGTIVFWGLTLPGYWVGRAWSGRLGRFLLRGSTGLGQGVMVTLADGRRVVLTPAHPVALVVQLLTQMRGARAGRRPS